MRRIEEAVIEIDGVSGVRVWELPDRVEIGITVAPSDAATDVLKRVLEVTDAMRAMDETWDVGLLSDEGRGETSTPSPPAISGD